MDRLTRLQQYVLMILLFATLLLIGALIWTGQASPSPSPSPSTPSLSNVSPSPSPTLPPAPTDRPTPSPTPTPTVSPTPTQPPTPPPPDKYIALTFDDGPFGPTTERLLDALEARGLSVTFFIIGCHAELYPDTLRRIADDGHEVANHTMNHRYFSRLSSSGIEAEMSQCSDIIEEITGKRPSLLRPPGGSITDAQLKIAKRQGLTAINWSVDTMDWSARDKDTILSNAFDAEEYTIRDGAIVLMHDIYEPTIDAAIEMMDRLMTEGYQIVTVTELLDLRRGGGEPGKLYNNGYPQVPETTEPPADAE